MARCADRVASGDARNFENRSVWRIRSTALRAGRRTAASIPKVSAIFRVKQFESFAEDNFQSENKAGLIVRVWPSVLAAVTWG